MHRLHNVDGSKKQRVKNDWKLTPYTVSIPHNYYLFNNIKLKLYVFFISKFYISSFFIIVSIKIITHYKIFSYFFTYLTYIINV